MKEALDVVLPEATKFCVVLSRYTEDFYVFCQLLQTIPYLEMDEAGRTHLHSFLGSFACR